MLTTREMDERSGSSLPWKAILGYSLLAACVIGALILISIFFGSFYTINQTQRGIVLRTGAISEVVKPGFHFKWPWIESVEKISLENRLLRWDKLEGYSHDQQTAHYMISVNYQLPPDRLVDIYSTWGGEDGVKYRIVTPNVLKQSKIVIGQFTAQTSIQDRGRLNVQVQSAIQDAVKDLPVIITAVNVEDIKFGKEYEDSINSRMIAEVNVQTFRQNLEREKVQAQIKVTQANAEADRIRAIAQANADGKRFDGAAEAFAIEAKAKALAQNSTLVELVKAQAWDGKLPTTMVPGGSVPMVGLGR